jgi:molybdenum cofactor biosynthesis enzyme MoaA
MSEFALRAMAVMRSEAAVRSGPEEPCFATPRRIQTFHRRARYHSQAQITAIHELERDFRCKDCSRLRGFSCKRNCLVLLRTPKISAGDPPSTWWANDVRL